MDIRNLNKKFGSFSVIDKISLLFPNSGIHSIIGPNGAGKSTLLNLIYGDLKADDGKILYNDIDLLKKEKYQRISLGIGRTYQTPMLITENSVIDNCLIADLGSKKNNFFSLFSKKKIVDKAYKKINATLTSLNIAHKKDFLVDELTHGEKKLLEIAMLLISDCNVLLLDEPLAGVDKIESDFIVNIICELSKSKLILLVEHDLEVVLNISNSVSVMNNGQLIISSDPKSVKNNTLVNQIYFDKANEK